MSDSSHRTDFTDFAEALRVTAERKRAAAASRSQPVDTSAPPPREVFMAAAMDVAGRLEPLGFKLRKSGPEAVRTRNGRREEIWFQSSNKNIRGQYVDFEVGIGVTDSAHKKWQVANGSPFTPSGGGGGGNIGNVDNSGYVTWDIACEADRPAVLAEVTERVHRVALPYFDLFGDPPALLERLVTQRPVICGEQVIVELVVRHAGPEEAARYIRRRAEEMGVAAEVRGEAQQLAAGASLDPRSGDWVRVFALSAHAFGLPL